MPNKSEAEFAEMLKDAEDFVKVGEIYRSYKSPEMTYRIAKLLIDSELDEVRVDYDALYGEKIPYSHLLKDFLSFRKHKGTTVSRFSLIED